MEDYRNEEENTQEVRESAEGITEAKASEGENREEKPNDGFYAYKMGVSENKPEISAEAGGKKQKKGKHNKSRMPVWLKVIIFAILFGIVAAVVFQAATWGAGKLFGKDKNEKKQSEQDEAEDKNDNKISVIESGSSGVIPSSTADMVEKCLPSIVSVSNLSVEQVYDWFGGVREYEEEKRASGIIVGQSDSELLIVTNNHVVYGAKQLTVTFADNESAEAKVKGANAEKDVAVMAVSLKDIKESTLDAIAIATLGDSGNIRVGEDAIIIGNALGYGISVTKGIISALDREFNYEEYGINCKMIQTDAAINPGNSGGALLNANGEVVGISDAKDVGTEIESICYAIPISDVKDLINDFMNRETKDRVDEKNRGILGIRGSVVDSQAAEIYGMPKGIYISEVIAGMGAEKAGINRGDIIVGADGKQIQTMDDLSDALSYFKIGETIQITVQRLNEKGEYQSVDFEVKVSANK